MSPIEAQEMALGVLQGIGASTVFILALFIGFCVIVGFTKTKQTAGGSAMVVKSLDERISHKAFEYLAPGAPRGPADQLKAPELTEKSSR